MSQPWEPPCHSSHASTALAVLLTHISHSYIALLQIVAQNNAQHVPPEPAVLPASPRYQTPSFSSQHAHMRTAEKQSEPAEPASDCANHQHGSSVDQGYPGVSHSADVATPVKLCPFQQELAERIMQAKNTVMFLPAGVLHERKADLSMSFATPTFQPVADLHALSGRNSYCTASVDVKLLCHNVKVGINTHSECMCAGTWQHHLSVIVSACAMQFTSLMTFWLLQVQDKLQWLLA